VTLTAVRFKVTEVMLAVTGVIVMPTTVRFELTAVTSRLAGAMLKRTGVIVMRGPFPLAVALPW
jgi:hypothetical protein